MTRKIIMTLIITILTLTPILTIWSDTEVKCDETMISEGKSTHINATVCGDYAAWFQQRINYWGYVVMLKNLKTGDLTCISNSETHLPIPSASDATKVFLSDKYCWWHAFGLSNFYDYKIFVYDIAQKKTYEFGDSTAQIINPVVVKDHLFYLRKIDNPQALELYTVKIGSKNDPKKIFTYDVNTWGYSYQTGDVKGDQVVWTDKGDLYMYDINKDKVTQLTKTTDTEYFPIIQNGLIYYNKLTWKNGVLVYTIYAYKIKDNVTYRINALDGAHWQRPSYNPDSNNFIFTQYYMLNGKAVYALCLYDPKEDITREVQQFPSWPTINSQCASKDFLVWLDTSTGKNNLKLYNYRTNETFVVNSTVIPDNPVRIDNHYLVWMDSRNNRKDLYGGPVKIRIKVGK